MMTTIGHLCIGKSSLESWKSQSSLDLYLDKHRIGCSRSTLKQGKEDWNIVAAYIVRSIVNNDKMNNEEDGVEHEEPDEEYKDDVVLKEIGDDSDEDEKTDTAQQREEMNMTARTPTAVIMTMTATTTTTTTTTKEVVALATMSMEATMMITAKTCVNKWHSVYYEI